MSGTAREVHLGRQLKALRSENGLSLEDAAKHVERSRATVGHWERGYSRISAQDLTALLQLYGASEELSEHLQQLRRDSRQRGWWHSYKLPTHLAPFVGFEAEAAEMFHFELGVIPGLLQTEDYTREIHKVGRLKLTDNQLHEWVEIRLRRQERLHEGGGFTLHTVIAEEALRREVGSPVIMAAQLERLEREAKRSTVNLQVLPYEAGAHVGSVGPITVLRFADAGHSDVAFSDTPLGGHVIDDLRDVAELSRLFSELQGQALPTQASRERLSSIRHEHMTRSKE
ncbi:helix-turn-helix domain-containing protein [Actinopolyspora sp. H202]|uniref:helix-turn-helix domain-containing protein n=1 Tax=Actinopolyspora sp. H202 TaxID=1500456 RepID=UPI003EE4EB12